MIFQQRKLGEIDAKSEAQIRALDLDRIEELGEALLDFSSIEDLRRWLRDLGIDFN